VKIKGKVKEHYNLAGFWQDMASTCVECGACNLGLSDMPLLPAF